MKNKLSLDTLAVDSFETSAADAAPRGTVHGHASAVCEPTPPVYADACTCNDTCLCRTAAYYCATVHATSISCDYSHNESCLY